VEIKPIDTLRGHPTYMTYYTDVRVPDTSRVGDVDGGWAVMRAALDVEHGAGEQIKLEYRLGQIGGHEARLAHTLTRVVGWASRTRDESGHRVIDQPSFRSTLARIATDIEVATLLANRTDPGRTAPGVGNGKKLFNSEMYLRASQDLIEAMGPIGLLSYSAAEAPAGGWAEQIFRDAPVSTIAGGSSEVMRDVIAERRLKLPTSRRAAPKA
jgi:alkylation response protein AidB-like acyl-CoA dehydrogenase